MAFTLALLLVTFMGAELVVRLTKPHSDLWVETGRAHGPDPKATWADLDAFAAYAPRPGEYHWAYQEVQRVKTVSSQGFISTPELPVTKPEGTTRVAFLGGSSTAGTGADPLLEDAQTWPWLVTEALRQAHPEQRFDFLNGAASGYTSFECYGRLWSRIRFYRPDVIVVYNGWNDLAFFAPGALEKLPRWRQDERGAWSLTLTYPQLEPSWVDHLIWWSQLLIKLRWKLHGPISGELGPRSRPLQSQIDLGYTEVWRQQLRLYEAAADVLGAKLYVCKQATLIVPGLDAADRARCAYSHHGFDNDAHVRAYQAFYKVIDEEIPPDRVIDATSLSGRPELFLDHVHLNPEGARKLAAIVAARIDEPPSN